MEKITNKYIVLLCGILWIIVLSGCAPVLSGAINATINDDTVVTKTADYFGVPQNEITVIKIHHGALSTTYNTRYDGKLYNCLIYYGKVTCKIPGA